MEGLPGGSSYDDKSNILCSVCKIKVQGHCDKNDEKTLETIHIMFSPWCPNVKEQVKSLKRSSLNVDAGPPKQNNSIPVGIASFIPKAEYPELSTPKSRRDRFGNFSGVVSVDDFVAAGFFLNAPPHDKVTCFWCNGSLEGWKRHEDPMKEHAKYYPGCAFLRQTKGTKFIYEVLKQRNSDPNLRYSHNPEILDDSYRSYEDMSIRKSSLVYGELPEADAHSLALDGFHFGGSNDLIVCFYCGLRMHKNLDTTTVKRAHLENSKDCQNNRDPEVHSVDYVMCFPCKHVIRNAENSFCTKSKKCPDCAQEVNSLRKLSNHMGTITMSNQQL